jgi:signal transduction histidine kinase
VAIDKDDSRLRVSAHVLVQLGSELVTDVEQALLECVKNAYDADSPGCRIEIDTRAEGSLVESGAYSRLGPHVARAENVAVEILSEAGTPISPEQSLSPDTTVVRKLTYQGRITIIDSGAGIPAEKIQSAWLMISGSFKRSDDDGPKAKTISGRTPLGDKGLGRLGTMKLGDILLVESATDPNLAVSVAQFRWKDCDTAVAVDEVPVHTEVKNNAARLKGTRVSVLGLNDIHEWRRKDRIFEIANTLAKLVSPFEVTSSFPVSVWLDGDEHSLLAVTNQVLSQAIAEFTFEWKKNEDGNRFLTAKARFKQGLFAGARSKVGKDRSELVFGSDEGSGFVASLDTFPRTKGYKKTARPDSRWLVEFENKYSWTDRLIDTDYAMEDPGDLNGAFYFFHLDNVNQDAAAAGNSVDRKTIKNMAGISILRDGFQVRSKNDWLDLAAGMTSGSVYHMRVNNTIGYFSLSGEHNFRLVEKSDREGFVEDAVYRGFFSIASLCRKFANESLESVRRAFDKYAGDLEKAQPEEEASRTPATSLVEIENALAAVETFKKSAGNSAAEIGEQVARLAEIGSASNDELTSRAIGTATRAIAEAANLHKAIKSSSAVAALASLQHEREEQREQVLALLESAAVGLSARGLAHELRTHLSEIRQRLTAIQKLASRGSAEEKEFKPHINAIRSSCSAIMGAAALIDPMLPKSRALKDNFQVYDFLLEYAASRKSLFEREGIDVRVSGKESSIDVRINRSRMLQVLDNLVSNSTYWLRRNRIVEGDEVPMVIELLSTANGYSVSDSGPGIDPHYEASLFEIFVSAKPERDSGQGLGLFISKQLLALDGCEISLNSKRNDSGRLYCFDVNLTSVENRS